nr:metalloproteinase inhibitor 1-like isoform X1 [Equus caballus]
MSCGGPSGVVVALECVEKVIRRDVVAREPGQAQGPRRRHAAAGRHLPRGLGSEATGPEVGPTMDPSFLLAFPLLLALSTPCSACICKLQHPQTFYCTSDVVVIADILGPGKDTKTKRGLQVNVTQILKAPGKNLRIQNIYSPLKFEDCGYELRTNFQSQLLIAGYLRRGKLHFTRCHLVYFWYRLTTEQRLGFQAAYRMGCSCQVQPCIGCWRPCPEPDLTECVWKQRDCDYSIWAGNQSMFSMCIPSASGHCEWARVPNNYRQQTPFPPSSSVPAAVKII